MKITDATWCVVLTDKNWTYSFHNDLKSAIESKHEWEEKEPDKYEVITYLEYSIREKNKWLTGTITEITEEHYWEMLGALPPLKWEHKDGVERFCMSEFMTGPYTSQYAQCDDKYYTKMVDFYDSSTFIKRDDLSNAVPLGEAA